VNQKLLESCMTGKRCVKINKARNSPGRVSLGIARINEKKRKKLPRILTDNRLNDYSWSNDSVTRRQGLYNLFDNRDTEDESPAILRIQAAFIQRVPA